MFDGCEVVNFEGLILCVVCELKKCFFEFGVLIDVVFDLYMSYG